MGIIRSEKRTSSPRKIEVSSDVLLSSTGAVNIHVPVFVSHMDFIPSSFRIEFQGKVLYIDPVVIDEDSAADYIFITHSHGDHFSLKDIRKLVKKETVIICPQKVSGKLSGYSIIQVKPGDSFNLENIGVEVTPAYNITSGFLGLTAHAKSALNAGYVISLNGVRIFHAGDTDYLPELGEVKNINTALVPIEGGNLTMTTEKAAELINKIKPSIVIPMHHKFGTKHTGDFRQLVHSDIKVIFLDGR